MRKFIFLVICAYGLSMAFAQDKPISRFEKVVNKIVKAINKKDYAGTGEDFDQNMEDFFPLEKRKPFFEKLLAQYGKIQKLGEPRRPAPNQAIFVAHCEHGKLDITVWLDENNNITGLLFHINQLYPRRRNTKPSFSCLSKVNGLLLGGETLRNSTNIMTRPIRGLHLTFLALTKRAARARARPK